jgi:hypothetical protein
LNWFQIVVEGRRERQPERFEKSIPYVEFAPSAGGNATFVSFMLEVTFAVVSTGVIVVTYTTITVFVSGSNGGRKDGISFGEGDLLGDAQGTVDGGAEGDLLWGSDGKREGDALREKL